MSLNPAEANAVAEQFIRVTQARPERERAAVAQFYAELVRCVCERLKGPVDG